jgi:hypothetical protein
MSKKYGFGLKLAVAAVAVAGVLGTVWAATPSFLAPNASNSKAATVNMTTSYEVVKEWTIDIENRNPKDKDILNRVATATEVSGPKNGNLGIVKIKTNSPGWDVVFKTENGGKLAKGVKSPTYTTRWEMSCMCVVTDTTYTITGKTNLKYTGTGTPDAQLTVAIGMLDNINNTRLLKGIATQQVPASGYSATPVGAVLLDNSMDVINPSTGAVTTAATPVSFINVLSDATNGVGNIGATTPLTVGGVEVATATTGAQVVGFGPTDTQYSGANAVPKDDWEYFFINVGLAEQGTGTGVGKLGGNEEGVYEETFSFTLVAIF